MPRPGALRASVGSTEATSEQTTSVCWTDARKSTAEGTDTFIGGTGRFADAAGTASFEATVETTPDGITHLTINFDGTIGY